MTEFGLLKPCSTKTELGRGRCTKHGREETTTLEAIREGAEKSGYAVEGFAPTPALRRSSATLA